MLRAGAFCCCSLGARPWIEASRLRPRAGARRTLDRKRQELARVLERLQSPPLGHGIARELRKQQAILEGEIAELEK